MLKYVVAVFAGLSLLAGSASAGIIMNVNPIKKTISFTGTDSGTPYDQNAGWPGDDPWYIMEWDSGRYDPAKEYIRPQKDMFNDYLSFDMSIGHKEDGNHYLSISLDFSQELVTTITGSGIEGSYAHVSTENQAALESFIGQTISVSDEVEMGVDWGEPQYSGIQVNHVVPEPTTIALLAAGGIALLRRKRKK